MARKNRGHIDKLSMDNKKKHFRHELGLGDSYARDGFYKDKFKLKMKMATGTPEEKQQAREKLVAMGETVNESLSEYLDRIKREKSNG